MERLIRVRSVESLGGFNVRLVFTDGTVKDVDLDPFLHGPVFQPLRDDSAAFATIHVDLELGTIAWDNGADIDPDVLYHGLKPAWLSEQEQLPR